MAKTVTTPWNPADHLKTDEGMAAYLEAALEEGEPALVAAALDAHLGSGLVITQMHHCKT